MKKKVTQFNYLTQTERIRLARKSYSILKRNHSIIREHSCAKVMNSLFLVSPKVFRINPSSIFIANNLKINHEEKVLDLGTGIGFLAILAAKKASKVIATDINPHAIVIAKKNAELHHVSSKIEFRLGDLFEPLDNGEIFDVIIWTPPWLEMEPKSILEKAWASANISLMIERFFQGVNFHLKKEGRIEMIFSNLGPLKILLNHIRLNNFKILTVSKMRTRIEKEEIVFFRLSKESGK